MKFKLGDKVRVKTNSKYHRGKYAGLEGKVIAVFNSSHPYDVQLSKDKRIVFHANELERV